ncbi:short chain dehydrogenase/reductase SDR [Aspergillus brunneoviolaceus CBS 621.78]|uniref:Short chain dehydrogenase/reductase SDR n=1 Tax=Aspergillus brunneoviolaceus CBS 621.78 TaxID=1450534 RepID=A0ACD1G616_9EURO|nr:short chain dehydrogenase/reductase SDR [Aspergillus brunneoviolaceus CBS 621.78]RAH44599.1 short chain dehydrogenase/reductase SDR [Aspergillus brunneoviolaceus CBS 621.78]
MEGTVVLTGANGSLALGFVQALLETHPQKTLVATVRNPSPEQDPNTEKLLALAARFPKAKFHLETLDLGKLANVRSFADKLSRLISSGALPRISAVVCNAASLSFEGGQKFTADGYEATFQVCHLAHYLLILKLLGSMNLTSGRIVMLGSITHYPEKSNPLCSLRPQFPADMEELLRPGPDPPALAHDRGFQRYATAKLANVTLANDLNRRLKRDDRLSSITAIAMDTGGLPSARSQAQQKRSTQRIFAVINFLMPVLKHATTMFRTTEDAGRDLVALSVDSSFQGKRGYYMGQKEDIPAAVSINPDVQTKLWDTCWGWCGLAAEDTVLRDAAPEK